MQFLFLLLLLFSPSAFAEVTTTDTGLLSPLTNWLLEYWNKFIDVINAFILSIWVVITDLLKSFMLTLQDMLKDVFFWLFDVFSALALYAISGLSSILETFDISSIVSGLPSEVLNMMGLLGMGTCLGMVGAAITVRLLLQIIPFVRLGA